MILTKRLDTVLTSMQLEDGSTAVIEVNRKAADYYGIVEDSPKMRTVDRQAYSYHRKALDGSDIGREVKVPKSRYTVAPRKGRRDNQRIRVAREEISPRGNVRTFTFTFPRRAKHSDISYWLWQHCHKNKPLYFLTEAGAKHGVWDYSSYDAEPDNL